MLGPRERSRLVESIAAHTVGAILEAGFPVGVVTADSTVVDWAEQVGAEPIMEPDDETPGLDRAARAGMQLARDRGLAWAIAHGDLPLVAADDFLEIAEAMPPRGVLLAPSYDGGTNVIAGDLDDFRFSYGPGSFRRHVATGAAVPLRILVRPGLALDLDSEYDLAAAALIGSQRTARPDTGSKK